MSSIRAYSKDNRPPPANYLPPTELPEFNNGFARLTPESMQRAYTARQRAEFDRQQRQRIAEEIRNREERTLYGIKQVNPDEWDDDEDAIPMGRVSSLFDQPELAPGPSPQIIYVEVPKKKKHKKEKKHKKKRKHSLSISDEADEEGTSSSATKRGRPDAGPSVYYLNSLVKVEKNKAPYKLLRKGELKYLTSHLFSDTKPDLENKKYDKASKYQVPEYKRQPDNTDRAIAERFPTLMKDFEQFAIHKDRLFTKKNMKIYEIDSEKTFRQKPADEFETGDIIKISHQMHDRLDGVASTVKFEPDEDMFNKMDSEDYEHFVRSQTTSYQEALAGNNIKAQYSVLHNKITMDKTNAKAWMEFIDIQRLHFANEESGYPEAEIQNKRAYYERVMEIVKKAIAANPANADLQIKRIQIMQEHLGVNSPDIKPEWIKLENRFINNIQMWEGDLKMRMNDRSTFKLEQTIEKIDHCINKLVNLKYGTIKSHPYMEGIDEFLITLLITRCRIFIATGHLAKAVGMIQALAEFHFFRPDYLNNQQWSKTQQWKKAKEEFKKFWEIGCKRIGEEYAEGWKRDEDKDIINEYEWKDRQQQWKDEEYQNLAASLEKFNQAELEEVNKFKDDGIFNLEARCRLEEFRVKQNWEPIKFYHDNDEFDMFKSRIVKFSDIEPVLFPLDNNAFIQDLIFKLLHLFGIPISGLKFYSQEDVLREFSSELFESNRPNSMDLKGFQDFFQYFIQLLAESQQMDSARIYAALATKISNSSMPKNRKIKQLKLLATNSVNGTLQRCFVSVERRLTVECQFSILIFAFDELTKLQNKADYAAMLNTRQYLLLNLDQNNTSIWDIGQNIENPTLRKLKNRERLFYMRFILYILRNLPFSDEEGAYIKFNNVKKSLNQAWTLKTKREFLLSLWANGTVSEIAKKHEKESIERAKLNVQAYLKREREAPKDLENLEWRWIGNEAEIIFELAALFSYEFPFVNFVQRYKFFQDANSPLFTTSELGKSLSDSTVLQEIRANVLEHIIHACKGLEFTPGNLVQFLGHQVKRFPHSITLLKMFIDNCKGGAEQIFLAKYSGKDDITRLIRSCGQIYVQRLRLEKNMDELNEEDKKRIVRNLVKIYTKVAENNSDNLVPDDYIWTRLIKVLMISARTTVSISKITEVFNLGQKVCPWSKEFLFSAAHNRPNSERHFLGTMNELIGTHGLMKFIFDAEVETYMTHQIG